MPGRTFSFEVTALSGADAVTLFDLVADGGRWSRWAGISSSWERQGDPPPGGVGAIRRLGRWPVVVREETVAYEQDRLHRYTMLTWAPLREYHAEVVLEPRESGTHVAWRGTFAELVPGTGPLIEWVMKRIFGLLTRRLVRAAGS